MLLALGATLHGLPSHRREGDFRSLHYVCSTMFVPLLMNCNISWGNYSKAVPARRLPLSADKSRYSAKRRRAVFLR